MMLRTRLKLISLFLILSVSSVQSAEPHLKMRTPDDRILLQLEKPVREVRTPNVPADEVPAFNPQPKNLFGDLPLSGPRGKESPSGTKVGRYCENGFKRAGFPNCIGRFAKPSTDAFHQVGYVGGGTLFGGSGRHTDEGTFGMDYAGHWFSRKIWLKWSHGERHQGGAGRYQTAGPQLLPE